MYQLCRVDVRANPYAKDCKQFGVRLSASTLPFEITILLRPPNKNTKPKYSPTLKSIFDDHEFHIIPKLCISYKLPKFGDSSAHSWHT